MALFVFEFTPLYGCNPAGTGTRTGTTIWLLSALVFELAEAVVPSKLGPQVPKTRAAVLVSALSKAVTPGKLGPLVPKCRVVVLVSVLPRAATPGKLGPQVPKRRATVLVSVLPRAVTPGKLGPQVPKPRAAVLVSALDNAAAGRPRQVVIQQLNFSTFCMRKYERKSYNEQIN